MQDARSPSNGTGQKENREESTISSNMMLNFRRGLPLSPHEGLKSNDDNISSSHEHFLKTGDGNLNLLDCVNLAGHVTNFVDNEGSLDFLYQEHQQY
jgi:hypothetical protein